MAWENELSEMLGNSDQNATIQLAVMTGPNSCKIGNLELKAEDLLINDRLTNRICTSVRETAPSGGGLCTDQSTYISALSAGDTVVVYQLSDSKFLILARVVGT